ncbi:hypothetical protein C7410_109160 [Paraburkholderia silvatlantica]|uniref:Uncharacterized protein n=1 Tax=Paraburkholderia silvatlantica TaxID=321895 RepID=A0A2V4TW75_9BURK|nr:hypothetical protein [Paraburkholderia silvatlantica]PYE22864.1 hypothetical protein C7410_109160 [Paraburkholderia silvatlantica]
MTDTAPPVVPAIERHGRPFAIRLRDIPQPWRGHFHTALRGSACPVIEGEGLCAYVWDWQDWLQGRFPHDGNESQARVIYDELRSVFIATVLATGATYKAADSDEIAAWLAVSGVEPGHVSIPRELIESAGDRMNINHMLRLIHDAEARERAEARGRPRPEKSDRLSRFITSPEFRERVSAAVEKAIAGLEAKGIKPRYIERERKD